MACRGACWLCIVDTVAARSCRERGRACRDGARRRDGQCRERVETSDATRARVGRTRRLTDRVRARQRWPSDRCRCRAGSRWQRDSHARLRRHHARTSAISNAVRGTRDLDWPWHASRATSRSIARLETLRIIVDRFAQHASQRRWPSGSVAISARSISSYTPTFLPRHGRRAVAIAPWARAQANT